MSGMEQGAKLGTLKAFVGGDAWAVEKAQPVLKAMAAEVIHLGPIGQGLAMKLVNNMLAQVGRIAVIEALVLGAKAGLDPQTMVDVIGHATGNSVAFQYTAPGRVARLRRHTNRYHLQGPGAADNARKISECAAVPRHHLPADLSDRPGRRAGQRRWRRNREDL